MNKRIKGSSLIERSFVLPHPCLPWGQEGCPSQLPSAWHICHCDIPKNNKTQKGSQQLSWRCRRSPSAAICLLDRPFWQRGCGKGGGIAPHWSHPSHSEDIPTWLPSSLGRGASSGGSHGAAEGSRTRGLAEVLSAEERQWLGTPSPGCSGRWLCLVQVKLLLGSSPLVWLLLLHHVSKAYLL